MNQSEYICNTKSYNLNQLGNFLWKHQETKSESWKTDLKEILISCHFQPEFHGIAMISTSFSCSLTFPHKTPILCQFFDLYDLEVMDADWLREISCHQKRFIRVFLEEKQHFRSTRFIQVSCKKQHTLKWRKKCCFHYRFLWSYINTSKNCENLLFCQFLLLFI